MGKTPTRLLSAVAPARRAGYARRRGSAPGRSPPQAQRHHKDRDREAREFTLVHGFVRRGPDACGDESVNSESADRPGVRRGREGRT